MYCTRDTGLVQALHLPLMWPSSTICVNKGVTPSEHKYFQTFDLFK